MSALAKMSGTLGFPHFLHVCHFGTLGSRDQIRAWTGILVPPKHPFPPISAQISDLDMLQVHHMLGSVWNVHLFVSALGQRLVKSTSPTKMWVINVKIYIFWSNLFTKSGSFLHFLTNFFSDPSFSYLSNYCPHSKHYSIHVQCLKCLSPSL